MRFPGCEGAKEFDANNIVPPTKRGQQRFEVVNRWKTRSGNHTIHSSGAQEALAPVLQ